MITKKSLLLLGTIMLLIMILAACGGKPTPAPTVAPTTAPTQAPVVVEPTLTTPYKDTFLASAHAKVDAQAFTHWNSATPAEVPTMCAKCHTSAGFQDFVGADGSAVGTIEAAVPAPAGTFDCITCHNIGTKALTSVTFPSGKVVNTSERGEALCMSCHQGRESKVSVDKQINETFKVTDVDAVVAPIKDDKGNTVTFGFRNIHYFAAGATLYGSQAQAGYEYDGKVYDPKFRHVDGIDTCLACHDQHATTVQVEKCAECHQGVKTVADLKNNREPSSLVDYNGNGDVKEGIYYELTGLQDILYSSIQMYATEVTKTPIVYDGTAYPYFFVAGADGKPAKDDKGNNVAYNAWSARLLKATYNYQLSVKDPGAFAHNAKYVIELLHDSIDDLNGKISKPVDITKLARNDAAHFAGDTEPFRHWDSTGIVDFGCAKCHSATGLPQFIKNGGTLVLTPSGSLTVAGIGSQPASNGFMCTTCHDVAAGFPARYAVSSVPFPSGAKLTFSTEKDDKGNLKPVDANLCIECHQGRESTNSVNAALKPFVKDQDKIAMKDDGKTPALSFRNVHYFAAGATLFGDLAKGAYQYDGQKYVGQNMHADPAGQMNKCTDCHDVHQLGIKIDTCKTCHTNVASQEDVFNIRKSTVDYNGNGDTAEGIFKEMDSFRVALIAEVQKYAETKAGKPIVYDPVAYPYFFIDMDKDGKPDKNDKGAPIAYDAWTPRLLKAAYNYQYSIKDPGGFAHNPKYVMQFLYDSIKDLGGDVSKFIRPE